MRKGTQPIPLYEIVRRCWKEGSVPQDMRDANIITFYKGERSYCNNYRGIPVYIEISLSLSLLSIVGNVFVRVIMTTL